MPLDTTGVPYSYFYEDLPRPPAHPRTTVPYRPVLALVLVLVLVPSKSQYRTRTRMQSKIKVVKSG